MNSANQFASKSYKAAGTCKLAAKIETKASEKIQTQRDNTLTGWASAASGMAWIGAGPGSCAGAGAANGATTGAASTGATGAGITTGGTMELEPVGLWLRRRLPQQE